MIAGVLANPQAHITLRKLEPRTARGASRLRWRILVDQFFIVLRPKDGSGRVSSWRCAPRDLDLARLDSASFVIRVAQVLISSACHSSLLDSSAGEPMQYAGEPGRIALPDCAR